MDRLNTEYINSVEYDKLEDKLKELKVILDDLSGKQSDYRKLRYADIDVEAEKKAGLLQPDELYVSLHLIDTNIRREQSAYVQYITQSPRAVILRDRDDPAFDLSPLETDITEKLRYDGWQTADFATIDGFQSVGYAVQEIVQDLHNPGELGVEHVPYGDFAFTSDTRDFQAVEMTARTYYFTRTRLLALCGDGTKPEDDFNSVEVDKVITKEPESTSSDSSDPADGKDLSLYKLYKVMFRVNGIVNVAWCCPDVCDDWVRAPRPLFIGRKKLSAPVQPSMVQMGGIPAQPQQPTWENDYETHFPYILFPYLISENDTIAQLRGRIFLDQDMQEAVSSLMSSTITQARRAAGLYFSKDVADPNDDLMMQKQVFFRAGCLINSKVTQFQLTPPDPSSYSAIQMLVSANQNETSQVNFAANNRKDSRKTAKEIETSERQEQQLSTVQVVLYAIALTQKYRVMVDVIKSRVAAGLITVTPALAALYARNYAVKPSGDIDVIEKQKLISSMMAAWPVVQNTPAAQLFLTDLMELMFPARAAKYIKAFEIAQAQAQSAQAQQQAQLNQVAMQMGRGIVNLAKKPEMFSEIGKIHALPVLENAAEQLTQMAQQLNPKK